MAYKKHTGMITVIFTGFTPSWIDAVNVKSGQAITIFLKYKMTDAMKKNLEAQIESSRPSAVLLSKREEPFYYDFIRFCSRFASISMQRREERRMAYQALEREMMIDHNPARTKSSSQSLVTGREALRTSQRTGNLLSRTLSTRIDNSKEFERERAELVAKKQHKDHQKFLDKLRKKYFEERFLQPKLTDKQWDEYLLTVMSNAEGAPKKDKGFIERELVEAGLM